MLAYLRSLMIVTMCTYSAREMGSLRFSDSPKVRSTVWYTNLVYQKSKTHHGAVQEIDLLNVELRWPVHPSPRRYEVVRYMMLKHFLQILSSPGHVSWIVCSGIVSHVCMKIVCLAMESQGTNSTSPDILQQESSTPFDQPSSESSPRWQKPTIRLLLITPRQRDIARMIVPATKRPRRTRHAIPQTADFLYSPFVLTVGIVYPGTFLVPDVVPRDDFEAHVKGTR